jgi:AraC-like DNA-binding protein
MEVDTAKPRDLIMQYKPIIKINTIEDYTELFGCPPANHPLISICRMANVKDYIPPGKPVQLNLYSIVMKDGAQCTTAKYGWREYDFRRGLLNFFAPGQLHSWDEKAENAGRWGWMLAFHPDFIRKYPLGVKISKLKFFSYETNEALHISDSERSLIEGIMENLYGEYKRNIDEHTQDIIVSQLEVLLNYAERFYTRQFRTRHTVESDIVVRFKSILHRYFEKETGNFITARDIASELFMSPHYLSDLLRNLTGMNTQQHIHAYIIERAKGLLLVTSLTVNEIAYSLGFEYPQYFSRLFKNKTGQTPLEFRKQKLQNSLK